MTIDGDFVRISPDVKLGNDVKIFAFVNLYGCEIGDESKIGTFVEIQRGAKIGRKPPMGGRRAAHSPEA